MDSLEGTYPGGIAGVARSILASSSATRPRDRRGVLGGAEGSDPRPGEVVALAGPPGSGVEAAFARTRLGGRIVDGFRSTHLVAVLGAPEEMDRDLRTAVRLLLEADPAGGRKAARRILSEIGLAHRAHLRCADLPATERARLRIARALALRPRILAGSDPFPGLAPGEYRKLGWLLRRLAERRGLAVVLALSRMDQAALLSDRVVGFRRGRPLFDLPASRFDDGPRAPCSHAFPRCGGDPSA
jgi:predicted ABC-type transport system involved in lysophospholipase L1 biosynthesis ATPase subunit